MSYPSELSNAKGVLSQVYKDQLTKSCVGGTVAVYRITDSMPANTTRTYTSVIPMKTPCFYGLVVTNTGRATDGSLSGNITQTIYAISQLAAGAATIGAVSANYGTGLSAGVGTGTSLVTVNPTYNAGTNAIDITIATQAPAQNRSCNFSVILEVNSAEVF